MVRPGVHQSGRREVVRGTNVSISAFNLHIPQSDKYSDRSSSAYDRSLVFSHVQPLRDLHYGRTTEHPINASLLKKLGQVLARTAAYCSTIRQCRIQGVDTSFSWAPLERATFSHVTSPVSRSGLVNANDLQPVLCVNISKLVPPSLLKNNPGKVVLLNYTGMSIARGQAQFVIKGVIPNAQKIAPWLMAARSPDFKFDSRGVFLLFSEAPLGYTLGANVVGRLSRFLRLVNLLFCLRKTDLSPTKVSLSEVSFKYREFMSVEQKKERPEYARNPPNSATVTIPEDLGHLKVQLLPPNSNPNLVQIADLERHLNDDPEIFMLMLRATLPCARALSRMERLGAASIRVRACQHFRIAYQQAYTVFDLQLKPRRDTAEWLLQELPPPGSTQQAAAQAAAHQAGQQRPQQVPQPIQRLPGYEDAIRTFMTTPGTGRRPLKTTVAANNDGIEGVLDDLDDTVRGIIAKAKEMLANRAAAAQNGQGPPNGQPPSGPSGPMGNQGQMRQQLGGGPQGLGGMSGMRPAGGGGGQARPMGQGQKQIGIGLIPQQTMRRPAPDVVVLDP
jgi:hypothetical protein